MAKLARLNCRNGGLNQCCSALNAAIVIGRKFENGDLPTSKILLVTDVLVGSDEQIEFAFGQSQQVAVLDFAPTALLSG